MISIVWLREKYIDYLKEFDKKVCANKNQTRPYIGVLFAIKSVKYFAPLSSPKDKFKNKKDDQDFIRINGGKLGYIKLNNMIPVLDDAILPTSIDKVQNDKYKKLLYKQLKWLRKHADRIIYKATRLYKGYGARKLRPEVAQRCCNFQFLEKKIKSTSGLPKLIS